MMRRRDFLAAMALGAASLATVGCEKPQDNATEADDLMRDVRPGAQATTEQNQAERLLAAASLCDFGFRFASAADEGTGNLLVSPLSAQMALVLAANGADGDTLSQMQELLGGKADRLAAGLVAIAQSAGNQLRLANSIWVREGYDVSQDFLQRNADALDADAYQSAFDEGTVRQINDWVSEKTNGMVTDILDQIPALTQLYLVNALALDAVWASPYTDDQVEQGSFTAADGSTQDVEFLRTTEYSYLELAGATGFVKAYEGDALGFVGLLPPDRTDPAELLSSLDAADWTSAITQEGSAKVVTAMPKLSYEWEADLAGALAALGMTDAFDEREADFSRMADPSGSENLYLGRVLHKTHIDLDERGTKAGAATVVEVVGTSAEVDAVEPQRVTLDRPFVYAIVDLATSAPVFLGIVRSVA